ncbi:MAG: acyl carrier protein [Ktedonobacterales bacterium]
MSEVTADVLTLDVIRQQIHEYIQVNFLFDGDGARTLDDTAPLVEQDVVDATGVLEIVLFLEEAYGIHVNEEDLTPENLDAVDNIALFVWQRLANV